MVPFPFAQSFEGFDRPFETVQPAGQPATLLLGAHNRETFDCLVTEFSVATAWRDCQATM